MAFAEVSVNSPAARRRTFSYAIPAGLDIAIGQAVWVPFGDKVLQGIVLKLTVYPAVEETREVIGLIELRPVLSPAHAELAGWISQHYLSPLFEAVALMLPPGFERKPLAFFSVAPTLDSVKLASLAPEPRQVFDLVQGGTDSLKELEKKLGKKKAQAIVTQLLRSGLLLRSYELEPARVGPKTVPYLSLAVTDERARGEAARLRQKGAGQQASLLELLSQPLPAAEARKRFGSAADALLRKGLLTLKQTPVKREPISYKAISPSSPLPLTSAQRAAFEAIRQGLERAASGQPPAVFLLHGVTASGKTEVYLQALAETVRMGRRGIVLVPEIALTPQTIELFASRFPGRVGILHSRLSLGEQFDEWQRIRDGEFDVVIGPRSAIFAPQPELGLIVIDEEHEWTYKQDNSPRYHARDVALKLGELARAVVVLGSATPDVETYYRAQTGGYHLLRLPERVTPGETLPPVEIVDLREELKSGNRSLFSRSLSEAMARALADEQQVILFLNRRGAATFIQCRSCGFVLRCRRCETALTLHSAEDALVCHQCNYRTPVPDTCPRCASPRLKFLGTGTQKLEEEAGAAFPRARLLRWDSDATSGRYSHQKILNTFRAHDGDILIGTQMVAKGLDLPLVTLVGVINADTALHLPDFRAGERTFQLLSQVAGRAGRGILGGRVIVQTFSPEHYAIRTAASHDYASFYAREIEFRRQLHNPPFTRLARLLYSHISGAACRREAERMKSQLASDIESRGLDLSLIGPAPAFVHRLRGRYRWQIILRGAEPLALLSEAPFPQGWTIDIDPVGLV